ncbi:MAG: type II secretion system minor pseudopilin GspI [Desulfobacteraceae bacterium]|nr:type II secretion system minor pseudopilin GspI [Desulfobacteraceae bacterium]
MLNFKHYCLKSSPEKGFTLLEVLVSLAIISIVLVSVISLQGQTIGMYESVRFYSTAPFLARSKLSEAALNPGEFSANSGDFGKAHPGYSWEAQVSEKEIQTGDQSSVRLSEIRVRVELSPDGLSYTLTRYQSVDAGRL